MLNRVTWIVLGGLLGSIVGAGAASAVKAPSLNSKRIINESYGFLKEREPQMSENEYALYEKVVPMAKDSPELVTQMLEGMVGGAEPPSPAFSFVLGNVYSAQEKFGPAEVHYRKAVDRHPDFQRAWSNLGLLYYNANRFEEAVQCLSRAVKLGDNDANTLATLAFSHYRVGNPASAELVYLQAVTVDPTDTTSLAALAGMLMENREYARAEPMARRLLRLKPEEKTHWSLYAALLAFTGRRVEAGATLELASTLQLTDSEMLLTLGDLYADGGDHGKADAIYRRVESLSPGEGTTRLLSRVRALTETGELAVAAAALDKISVPPGRDARSAYLRAVVDLRRAQHDWPAARTALEELLQLKPTDGDAWLALGRLAVEAADLSRAELAFAEAAKQPGVSYLANLELANLALRGRRYKDSIELLEAALAIERTPSLVRHVAQIKAYLVGHEPLP